MLGGHCLVEKGGYTALRRCSLMMFSIFQWKISILWSPCFGAVTLWPLTRRLTVSADCNPGLLCGKRTDEKKSIGVHSDDSALCFVKERLQLNYEQSESQASLSTIAAQTAKTKTRRCTIEFWWVCWQGCTRKKKLFKLYDSILQRDFFLGLLLHLLGTLEPFGRDSILAERFPAKKLSFDLPNEPSYSDLLLLFSLFSRLSF